MPFEGARIQRERIIKQDINVFGATIGCPGCTGGDRLGPTLFFEFGQLDFGQFRLRPISTSANSWGQRKSGARKVVEGAPKAQKGGTPKGGVPRVEAPNLEKVGPEGWGPQGWGPEGWSPEGWGAQNFALLFTLPPQFSSSFSLLGFLRGILVVFEAAGP